MKEARKFIGIQEIRKKKKTMFMRFFGGHQSLKKKIYLRGEVNSWFFLPERGSDLFKVYLKYTV